jgi:hypothetical protein
MWEVRCHPGVVNLFARTWGVDDDELITGFDGIGVQLEDGHAFVMPWHVDQDGSHPDGMVCVQALLALSESAATEFAIGTHDVHPQFAKSSGRQEWQFVTVATDKVADFEKVRPRLHAGDVLLWDSRTVHRVNTDGERRVVAYLSMVPTRMASAATLRRRRQMYDKGVATTHWAHRPVERETTHRPPSIAYADACARRKTLIDANPSHNQSVIADEDILRCREINEFAGHNTHAEQ